MAFRMNEPETEYRLIDPSLSILGWNSDVNAYVHKQFPITQGRIIGKNKREKPLKADYVLRYKNRLLAVVEAKRRELSFRDGVGQAKKYADMLQIRFAYSTNGDRIYEIDMLEGVEGEVDKFPTPQELWEKTYPTPNENYKIEISSWKDRILSVPFEDRSGTWQPRYYQENAITKVAEAIADRKDRILLTLATGTGKTAIAFQIAWKLFNSRWNLNRDGKRQPRILFLADRNILANQAFNSFSAFPDDALIRIKPSEIRKNQKVPTNGSIFFTIFQTFMSGDNDTPYFGEYPPDFFDLIIIDECHRGGANDESNWRDIMEYFKPAVQLGLTATPKRKDNADTYKYFGEPVYTYSLKQGINDGFLTPFRVVEIDNLLSEYEYNPDDDILDGEIEEGKIYKEGDFNRNIISEERELIRVKQFLKMINQNQKTIVFCATQEHAALVRDLINQNCDSKSPNYCHRVTANDGAMGETYLKEFQDNERTLPTILTTSQKLSTGVDAPEVRNIILLRPVNSIIEFKQIVGRGTRLYDSKDYFTIYDFVKARERFEDPEWDGEPIEKVNRGRGEICEECGKKPCECNLVDPPQCEVCGTYPCICEKEPRNIVKIKLGNNTLREIRPEFGTSFWDPEGKPISAEDFMKKLFGDIPTLFKNEAELRELWSKPDTRKQLLSKLEEKGYSEEQLNELKKLVNGEDSDIYDVLNYIAYHKDLLPRAVRANNATINLKEYDLKLIEFLNFVLNQYINIGVSELDDLKLPDLLEIKYGTISDAKNQLGDLKNIRNTFIDFQRYIYM